MANSDFDVKSAKKRLLGDVLMSNNAKRGAGSSIGLLRAIPYASYVNIQGTADSSYNRSKITGLIDCPGSRLTIEITNT